MADDELRAMIDEFDRDGDGESTFLVAYYDSLFAVRTLIYSGLIVADS